MVSETSLLAYADLIEKGQISLQEGEVLSALNSPKTSREVSSITDLERCAVTGRLNSLEHKGFVKVYDKVTCSVTGKYVKRYIRKDNQNV